MLEGGVQDVGLIAPRHTMTLKGMSAGKISQGGGCSCNDLFSAGFREVDAVVVDSGGRLHDSAKIKSAYQLADGGHEYKTVQ